MKAVVFELCAICSVGKQSSQALVDWFTFSSVTYHLFNKHFIAIYVHGNVFECLCSSLVLLLKPSIFLGWFAEYYKAISRDIKRMYQESICF